MPKTQKKIKSALWYKFKTVISHRVFFWTIVILFALQMLWIAFSAIYPMLFDEEYHLGIIEIYSRQLSPFIAVQPPEAAFHGDITRLGSYLFHYLMSFPYRIVSLFTNDLMTHVILLRVICIGFVLIGVVLWRKFLIKIGLSKSLSHLAILTFTLVPLVPFALAQLNYDSLAFLCVPALFLLALKSSEENKKQPIYILALLSLSAFSGLVKFTMLPIALAAILFVTIVLYQRHQKNTLTKLITKLKKISKPVLFLSLVVLTVASFLFIERYGTNLVMYRNIEPKCHQVHSTESCMQYTVWRRDTTWKANNDAISKKRDNPIIYTGGYWVPHIFGDFFVTAAFVYDKEQPLEIRYLPTTMQASAGNKVLRYGGWAMLVFSLIAVIISARYLWKINKKLTLLILLTLLIYTVSLWVRNYTDYLRIGSGTAAQGRYFVPLLIPIFAVVSLAINHFLRDVRYKTTFIIISAILFTQGGGVGNYILYSNTKWYWPENRATITKINKTSQKILRTLIPF